MVTDFLIENGDIVLDSVGKPTVLIGERAVHQIVNNTLAMWKTEYFRDITRGVNWIRILGKRYSKNGIIQELTRALLKSSYVDEIVDISIKVNAETRNGEIYYTIVSSGRKIRNILEV